MVKNGAAFSIKVPDKKLIMHYYHHIKGRKKRIEKSIIHKAINRKPINREANNCILILFAIVLATEATTASNTTHFKALAKLRIRIIAVSVA